MAEPPEIDPASLARAEAALAALSSRYLEWAEADLHRLEACHATLQTGGAPLLAALHAIAHDMKGQAATFDYPLVGELAARLCRRTLTEGEPDSAAIGRLVGALGEAIRLRLSGDGGDRGRRLLAETGD